MFLINLLIFLSKNHRIVSVKLKKIVTGCLYLHVLINIIISSGFLYVSNINYPGGHALLKLHEIESKSTRKLNAKKLKFLKLHVQGHF